MELNHLKTFLKVVERHSFSQAAEQLGYAQPTVSAQIAKLEQELHGPLFERLGHRIALTERGQKLLPYVQQMLFLEEQIGQDLGGGMTAQGTLKIAIADSLCSTLFPDILLAYRQRFPQVSVITQTGPTEVLFSKLAHNEADLVYTLDSRISRSDLVVQQEQPEDICFCAAAGHPLVSEDREQVLRWEDIRQYPLFLTEAGVSYRYLLERSLGELGHELRPDIELGDVQTLLRLVSRSDGISFLPEFVIKDAVDSGRVAILPVAGLHIRAWRQLIYHKGKYITPAMQGMLDLLHQRSGGSMRKI